MIIAVLGAYAIARLNFPGRAFLARSLVFTYLVPTSLLFIPMFALMSVLRLTDSLHGLIIAYLGFDVPFCTWLLMGYFRTIPQELEECALIDGATRWQILTRIVLPLAVPGLISAGIFAFTLSWNEFLVSKVLYISKTPMLAPTIVNFIDPINRAIDAGVSVTTFAADSPKSKRTAYITSDNLAEAAFAAEEIVKAVGDSAEYAVLENPGQSNHDLRVTALIAYMEKNYPNMKLVGRQATNQDPNAAFTAVSAMLQANPDLAALWIPESGSAEGAVAAVKAAGDKLVIIHADISPTTLEEIKAGNIHMALNPNQGIQGFIGFMNTFLGAHPGLIDPFNDYKTSGYNPMQIPFVDNGFAVITKDNADSFVLEAYMEGRN